MKKKNKMLDCFSLWWEKTKKERNGFYGPQKTYQEAYSAGWHEGIETITKLLPEIQRECLSLELDNLENNLVNEAIGIRSTVIPR